MRQILSLRIRLLTQKQARKLKLKLRELISLFLFAPTPAARPLKQTAGATAEHKQEVRSLNQNKFEFTSLDFI